MTRKSAQTDTWRDKPLTARDLPRFGGVTSGPDFGTYPAGPEGRACLDEYFGAFSNTFGPTFAFWVRVDISRA